MYLKLIYNFTYLRFFTPELKNPALNTDIIMNIAGKRMEKTKESFNDT